MPFNWTVSKSSCGIKEKEGIPKIPKPSNMNSKEVPICNNVPFQTVNCETPLTGPKMSRMIAGAAMYDKHISADAGTMLRKKHV